MLCLPTNNIYVLHQLRTFIHNSILHLANDATNRVFRSIFIQVSVYFSYLFIYNIQIKICAAGWLVRYNWIPYKPALALGTISCYSAQILICFITYVFQFSIPLWLGLGTWHFRTATVPSAIVTVIGWLLIRQSNRPACLAWAKVQQGENTLWHLCHRTGETDRWNGCNPYQ